MTYSLHYLLKGVNRGTSHHRGTPEGAIAAARAGLVSHGADSARILDETGRQVAEVQRSA
jgi:hypothetical protein